MSYIKLLFRAVFAVSLILLGTLSQNIAVAGDVDCGNVPGNQPGPDALESCGASFAGDDDIVDGSIDADDLGTDSVGSDEIVADAVEFA